MSKNRRLAKIKTFKVGVYLRLSVEDGGHKKESESITNQRMLAQDYLKRHEDMVFVEEYVDDGETGYLFDRPSFQRMLQDAKDGIINCILVKDQSRFGRNQIEVETLIKKRFREYNVRFVAILDNYDSLTSGYDMMFSIRNLFNEHYAQDISAKCQASFKTKQRSGEFVGAFACYGYQKSKMDRHRLEIDPYTIINNLRNLLGPHHLEVGESYFVGPHNFHKEACLWNNNVETEWNDGYCFVAMGI